MVFGPGYLWLSVPSPIHISLFEESSEGALLQMLRLSQVRLRVAWGQAFSLGASDM